MKKIVGLKTSKVKSKDSVRKQIFKIHANFCKKMAVTKQGFPYCQLFSYTQKSFNHKFASINAVLAKIKVQWTAHLIDLVTPHHIFGVIGITFDGKHLFHHHFGKMVRMKRCCFAPKSMLCLLLWALGKDRRSVTRRVSENIVESLSKTIDTLFAIIILFLIFGGKWVLHICINLSKN